MMSGGRNVGGRNMGAINDVLAFTKVFGTDPGFLKAIGELADATQVAVDAEAAAVAAKDATNLTIQAAEAAQRQLATDRGVFDADTFNARAKTQHQRDNLVLDTETFNSEKEEFLSVKRAWETASSVASERQVDDRAVLVEREETANKDRRELNAKRDALDAREQVLVEDRLAVDERIAKVKELAALLMPIAL